MKKLFPLVLVAALVFSGCTAAKTPSEVETPPAESSVVSSEPVETPKSSEESEQSGVNTIIQTIEDEIKEMTANQYDGLEFTAAILERKAIIPGGSMRVNISIKNTGDKVVTYEHGSQGAEVPSALYAYSTDLQTVPPEGNLGPMTMDMQTYLIEPGAEIKFDYILLAIEPNPNFDTYAMDVYTADESEYIANLGPDELIKRFPDIKLAAAGNYKGRAIFRYRVEGVEEMTYAETEFDINVTG